MLTTGDARTKEEGEGEATKATRGGEEALTIFPKPGRSREASYRLPSDWPLLQEP